MEELSKITEFAGEGAVIGVSGVSGFPGGVCAPEEVTRIGDKAKRYWCPAHQYECPMVEFDNPEPRIQQDGNTESTGGNMEDQESLPPAGLSAVGKQLLRVALGAANDGDEATLTGLMLEMNRRDTDAAYLVVSRLIAAVIARGSVHHAEAQINMLTPRPADSITSGGSDQSSAG